jgi:hypothetical protein
MKAGDPVWYTQIHRGGYGFANKVPALFVRTGKKRVTITVLLRTGGTKQIVVHPNNVSERDPSTSVDPFPKEQ